MCILHPQRVGKEVSFQGKGKLSIWEQTLRCEQLCRDPLGADFSPWAPPGGLTG